MVEKIKCPGCGAMFDTLGNLIDHVVEKHNSNCQICGSKTKTRNELLMHNQEIYGI